MRARTARDETHVPLVEVRGALRWRLTQRAYALVEHLLPPRAAPAIGRGLMGLLRVRLRVAGGTWRTPPAGPD